MADVREIENVVRSPPEGNDPDAPGSRQITETCRHDWIPEPHPMDIVTGYMVCVWCKMRVRARPQDTEPYTPRPRDPYTAY